MSDITMLAPLGVLRVPSFGEVFLGLNGKDKFLAAFNTDQDFVFQNGGHGPPSSMRITSLLDHNPLFNFLKADFLYSPFIPF